MEPVPEPALAADVAGETDAAGTGAGAQGAGETGAGAEPAAEIEAEVAVDGRAAVVASIVVNGEVVVPVPSPDDGVEPGSPPAAEVEVDVEAVEVDEVVAVAEVLEVADDDEVEAVEVEVEAVEVEVTEVVEVELVGDAVDDDVLQVTDDDVLQVTDEGLAIGYDALLAAAEQVLDDVDGALVRLQDGTYGRCEVCDDGIADDRLAAEPTARTCERHLPLAHAG
jgi:RNA polymerase-binding transcription factor DksA